jgi:alpha-beta hydrolase superfamily lysophospholipase
VPKTEPESDLQHDADILGPPYAAETLRLRPDDEGEVVATLVRRVAEGSPGTRKAVLHVHGFCDYFFQTGAADFWVERGYDFYALDLRKYGRSLRPHQTPNYVADLRTYYEELDLAYERVVREHDHVVFSAHSTGGLTLPLWLHDRRHSAAGVFLNAPWIDMHGDVFTRLFAMPAIHRVALVKPMRLVPRTVTGVYARSLHRDFLGTWDFDLAWKPELSWPVYAGWIRAVRVGQARIARGLEIDAPVLMMSSSRSGHPTSDDHPDVLSTDVVLDVERMRRRAGQLSRHVTIVQVPGALHDVTLSPEPALTRVYDELDRFVSAYVD